MAAFNMAGAYKAYCWGLKRKEFIHDVLHEENGSRFTMHPRDGAILASIVTMCPGPHFEIGMLQGGSAILAAWAKKRAGHSTNVYGCDPFGWAPGQSQAGPEPSIETVMSNADLFGVAYMIRAFEHAHPPLPDEISDMRFDTTFIDGDHTYQAALEDWRAAKKYTDKFVLFHDVHKIDVSHGSALVFREAREDPDWEFYYEDAKMGVVRRNENR